MKKIVLSTLLWITFALPCFTSASVSSSDAFMRAFDEGIITSLRIQDDKKEYLTREKAAPLLVNYIYNVARREYRWDLCTAKDISMADEVYQYDLRLLCDYWILHWSNNRISPKRTLSKQEAVALVMRIVDGESKEKKTTNWADEYYKRASDYWFLEAPKDDKQGSITIEEFIHFLYSTKHPFEKVTKDNREVRYTSVWNFQTSDDALLRLVEIIKER